MSYYLLKLRMLTIHADHTVCTEHECTANNVKLDGAYKTRHTSSSCVCDHVAVSPDSICEMIGRGKLPLVKIELKFGRIRLSLREARPLDRYVAVSHVWSEGLGNPTGNGLPECQLNLLWRRLRNLPNAGNVSFHESRYWRPALASNDWFLVWMDTLCIPTRPEDETFRARAIDRMNLVYAVADKVLVLDAGLENARIGASEMAETAARIAFSTWMSRSWTLQEGVLARDCFFQFNDGAIEPSVQFKRCDTRQHSRYLVAGDCSRAMCRARKLRNAGHSARREGEAAMPSIVEFRLFQMFYTTVNLALKPAVPDAVPEWYGVATIETRSKRFRNIWNSLALRSTSMQSDLHLIFANLLHYSTASMTAALVDDRMRSILTMTEELPVGLLFNSGPRLGHNENGYNRWIPVSPSTSLIRGTGAMRLTRDRLWLDSANSSDTLALLLATGLKRCNDVYIRYTAGKAVINYLKLTARQTEDDCFHREELHQVCYIIDEDLMCKEDDDSLTRPWQTRTCAARLAVVHQSTETEWHGFQDDNPEPTRVSLKAVYDCPIEARWLPGDAMIPPGPEVFIVDSEDIDLGIQYVSGRTCPWRMEIDSRSTNAHPLLVQRPELENSDLIIKIRGVFIVFALSLHVIIHVVLVVLRIVIAVHIGWRGTTLLYKASLVLAFPCVFDFIGGVAKA
nr:hypothetical protein B0A51_00370 [Rachicladosporium sp. CCFEE 5018]